MKFPSTVVAIALSAGFLSMPINVDGMNSKLAHKAPVQNVIENLTNEVKFNLRRGTRNLQEEESVSESEDSPSDSNDEGRKLQVTEEASSDEDESVSESEDSPSDSNDESSDSEEGGRKLRVNKVKFNLRRGSRNLQEEESVSESESESESEDSPSDSNDEIESLDENESENMDENGDEGQGDEREIVGEEILGEISLLDVAWNSTANWTDGMVGYNETDESESSDMVDSESGSESSDEDESESLDDSSDEDQEDGLEETSREKKSGQVSLLELRNSPLNLTDGMVESGDGADGESESESESESGDESESESLDESSDEMEGTPSVNVFSQFASMEDRDITYNMTDGTVSYNRTEESESLDEDESESLDEDESESLDSSSDEEQEEGLNEDPTVGVSLLELRSGSMKVPVIGIANALLGALMMGVVHVL